MSSSFRLARKTVVAKHYCKFLNLYKDKKKVGNLQKLFYWQRKKASQSKQIKKVLDF